jgi:hypothetical protein
MTLRKLVALASALWLSAHAADARGQAWLADRARTEGAGVRTGNVEWHPGIGGEFGYDSNWFQRAGESAGERAGPPDDTVARETAARERVIPALRLRITPHVALTTLGPSRTEVDSGAAAPPDLRFRAQSSLRYNEFFAITDDPQVPEQRHLAWDLGGQLDIKPYGRWGADLNALWVRTVDPSNALDTAAAFDRSNVTGGGGIAWRPGGGLFRWRLGYQVAGTIFEREGFDNLNNVRHEVTSQGRWLFLPRTALLSQSSLGFIRYGSDVSENSGDYVRSLLGINGLITYHLGFLAMAGWGATFYERTVVEPENFDSAIGQVEVSWYPTPQSKLQEGGARVGVSALSVGYTRDFGNSYLWDYFQLDRVYTRFGYLFGGGLFLLTGGAGYTYVTRPTIHFADGRNGGSYPSFSENRVDAMLFLEYRLSHSVGLHTTFMYDANLTHQQIPNGLTRDQGVDDLGFQRFQAYIGARWFL